MKNYLLFLLLLGNTLISAQKNIEKLDYIWVLGYNDGGVSIEFGTTILDFNFSPPKAYRPNKMTTSMRLANASIANKQGELLLVTNGCYVADSTSKEVKNSYGLNPGYDLTHFCDVGLSYTVENSHIFLPFPSDSNRYALFHVGNDYYPNNVPSIIQWLSYSEINMSSNQGKPEMTIKNDTIVSDTVYYGHLTACRHGNGRDWWVISPKKHGKLYYKFLLSPQGLSKPMVQEIGDTLPKQLNGQAVFTPDGNKYVRYDPFNGIQIFDFDRCTGKLFNYKHIPSFTDNYKEGGGAISPNSRFLYVTKRVELWQFDLWADNVSESRVLIAKKDTLFVAPFLEFNSFYSCMLAPDGKIYMCGTGGHRYWNVIHNPNEKGLACDFRQHDIKLPTWNYGSIPNFPNYRLYDKKGSPCDTLGINDPLSLEEKDKLLPHKIYPNPTTGFLNVEIAQNDFLNIKILIINSLGEIVLQEKINKYKQNIDLYNLQNGTYFYQILSAEKVLARGKVILIR